MSFSIDFSQILLVAKDISAQIIEERDNEIKELEIEAQQLKEIAQIFGEFLPEQKENIDGIFLYFERPVLCQECFDVFVVGHESVRFRYGRTLVRHYKPCNSRLTNYYLHRGKKL